MCISNSDVVEFKANENSFCDLPESRWTRHNAYSKFERRTIFLSCRHLLLDLFRWRVHPETVSNNALGLYSAMKYFVVNVFPGFIPFLLYLWHIKSTWKKWEWTRDTFDLTTCTTISSIYRWCTSAIENIFK